MTSISQASDPVCCSGPELRPRAMAGQDNLVPSSLPDPCVLAKSGSWSEYSKGDIGNVIEEDVSKSIIIKEKKQVRFNCIEQKDLTKFLNQDNNLPLVFPSAAYYFMHRPLFSFTYKVGKVPYSSQSLNSKPFLVCLDQWFLTGNDFASPGTFGNVWRHLCLLPPGKRGYWCSSDPRPGVLLSIGQCTAQPPEERILQPQIPVGLKLKNPDLK